MAGGLQHRDSSFPEMQFKAIVYGDVSESRACFRSDIDLRARACGQFFVPGNKIGVQMGFKNMADS